MDEITLRPVTSQNWGEALRLGVAPEQQRFLADHTPVVALGLAKAYVGLGGATWEPSLLYAGEAMVGFVELAYESETPDQYWVFHFFIDQRFQGRGYGRIALARFIAHVRERHPGCQTLQLVVHPENTRAQRLYTSAGFRPTGALRWGEPVYQLPLCVP